MAKNGTRKDKSCLFVGMLQPLKSKLLGPLKLGNNGSRSDLKGQSINKSNHHNSTTTLAFGSSVERTSTQYLEVREFGSHQKENEIFMYSIYFRGKIAIAQIG